MARAPAALALKLENRLFANAKRRRLAFSFCTPLLASQGGLALGSGRRIQLPQNVYDIWRPTLPGASNGAKERLRAACSARFRWL